MFRINVDGKRNDYGINEFFLNYLSPPNCLAITNKLTAVGVVLKYLRLNRVNTSCLYIILYVLQFDVSLSSFLFQAAYNLHMLELKLCYAGRHKGHIQGADDKLGQTLWQHSKQ